MTRRGVSRTTPYDSRSDMSVIPKKTRRSPRGERRARRSSRSEDFSSAFQRLPDAPGERDADEEPEQRGLPVEPALADAERALRAPLAGGRGLQLGDLVGAHVPLGIDRLDQVVADQAGDQHGAQDVHG